MLTGLGLAALLSNVSSGSLSNNIVDNLFFLIFASFISLMITSFSIYNISSFIPYFIFCIWRYQIKDLFLHYIKYVT